MSKEVVEVIRGKHQQYEIVRETGVFSTKFFLRRDEEHYTGPYDSLADAVAAAEHEMAVELQA